MVIKSSGTSFNLDTFAILSAAGIRDGAMSILIGIAARKSIETGQPVKIAELTDLDPRAEQII